MAVDEAYWDRFGEQKWITVNGARVPLEPGQSKAAAAKAFVAKKEGGGDSESPFAKTAKKLKEKQAAERASAKPGQSRAVSKAQRLAKERTQQIRDAALPPGDVTRRKQKAAKRAGVPDHINVSTTMTGAKPASSTQKSRGFKIPPPPPEIAEEIADTKAEQMIQGFERRAKEISAKRKKK